VTTILIILLRINWPNIVHFMIYGVQGQSPSAWVSGSKPPEAIGTIAYKKQVSVHHLFVFLC